MCDGAVVCETLLLEPEDRRCFFLPGSEVAKIWMLTRAKPWTSISQSWKFSCELKSGDDSLMAEVVFHSGWNSWNWGNGEENTLVGEVTKLTITHGDVQSSPVTSARFLSTPVFRAIGQGRPLHREQGRRRAALSTATYLSRVASVCQRRFAESARFGQHPATSRACVSSKLS
jgi:hypothetical protein